jgi:hypothetical protein
MTPDSVPVVAEQTSGLSPKAILAGLMPALGTVVAVLIMGAVTGEFDRLEVATALTGFSGPVRTAALRPRCSSGCCCSRWWR